MKALLYDPYLDTLGGGERYCLSIAECLLKAGWEVNLLSPDSSSEMIKKSEERFDLQLKGLKLLYWSRVDFLSKLKWGRAYDLIFWFSDGSVPFLFGKKNWLHIQSPLLELSKIRLTDFLKVHQFGKVVCNSEFTQSFLSPILKKKSVVLYPPVDVAKFAPGKKDRLILGVGRFEETMQAKRQDILIRAFKEMVDEGLEKWQLVLIGGSLAKPEENDYLKRLKEEAGNYPIEFMVNAPFRKLQDYYSRASLFWHAAGYGVEEEREPWKVEHFGITTVEAMGAGCVPLVINKGGLQEIVRRGEGEGERWETVDELKEKTWQLANDSKRLERAQKAAFYRAQDFSKEKFSENFLKGLQE